MHEITPGVERAVAAAEAWARRLGAAEVRLVDYALGLLEEEEGRPAALLERLGLAASELREALAALPLAVPRTVPLRALVADARNWSLAHRADPAVLTDAFFLAVLHADPEYWQTVPLFDRLAEKLASCFADEESPMARADEPSETFRLDPDEPSSAWNRVNEVPDAPTPKVECPAENILADLSTARILDVNLNRGREALRVLEDYCRFSLDDRFLTEQVKAARHGLAAISARIPEQFLLSGRDTLHDVGTVITAGSEYERGSPVEIARINCKRLQEALRSLEEYGKLLGPDLGREFEAIRYRIYTLERTIVLGRASRDRLKDARLYVLLTGAQCSRGLEWVVERAAAGGATIFQLREKGLSDRELLETARNARRWTHKTGTMLIVNDRPDIARLADADGVHLGQDDLAVKEARSLVGADALIGVSTHSLDQLRKAILDGADYMGVGPTFPSKTKAFSAFPGLDFLREACRETSLPLFALGGIESANVGAVAAAGARRIAVGAAIAGADDPERAARELLTVLTSRPTSTPP